MVSQKLWENGWERVILLSGGQERHQKMMVFVFGLELGFHQGDGGAEKHPGWGEYGSLERSTCGVLGDFKWPLVIVAQVTLREVVREVDRFGPYLAAGAVSLSLLSRGVTWLDLFEIWESLVEIRS